MASRHTWRLTAWRHLRSCHATYREIERRLVMAIGTGLEQPGDAVKMQILSTEHWSLLATRSLTYSESLTRAGMFLSVLSGAVIALALIAQADRFGRTFVLVAILLLSIVLFVGLATVARL